MKRTLANTLRPPRHALLLGLGATLAGWTLAVMLGHVALWRLLEYKVFDLLSVATAPLASQTPITIVGIDEASATQLNLNWPFPRSVHAEVIDRLVEAGAAVIAFDVQFSQPTTPEDDARFARAIAAAGNVVLASSYDYYETAGARVFQRMDPVTAFTQAGATVGWTDMELSGDGVPRRMALDDQSFWLQAIRTLIRVIPDALPGEPGVPPQALIRHLGPQDTFPIIPFYQVLNRDSSIEGVFTDAIVLIGRTGGASTDINVAQTDAFLTPFTLTSGQRTSGVEIHATQIENALLGNMLEPASPTQNLLLLSAAMLLVLPALIWWNPLRSSITILMVGAGVVGIAYWMFRDHSVWYAAAGPLAGIGVAFVGTGTGAFVTERRRAERIRSTFAMYVSGDVVQEMIANPDKLKLGGERRDVSVLFSDLAGFTSLSERLEPDEVAQVVNMYLTAMTRVIMAHGGTVDKFIGDAVMAFWGAPLDDPQHALHALKASIAMQQAMQEMQPALRELGADTLSLRIGINSGPAIIGNMGSDIRFDYTAIGDTVNLAARLEGANKAYDTPILVSERTRQQVQHEIPLRQVDRVRVKGKEHPVTVYTPCEDSSLVEITGDAWQAYLARDWTTARSHVSMLRKITPDCRLAAMMHERIAAHEARPPPAEWDGSVALDKL